MTKQPVDPSKESDRVANGKPIAERFADALSELIGMCMEAGMHTSEMIEPMEAQLKWLRDPRELESVKDLKTWPDSIRREHGRQDFRNSKAKLWR